MNIQQKTKFFLKAKGWTQDQLAKAIGIHPVTLCRILGSPQRKTARERLVDFINKNWVDVGAQDPNPGMSGHTQATVTPQLSSAVATASDLVSPR